MKHIAINEPCSEDWNQMTSTEQGRYCKKCALEVTDFSGMDSGQIRRVLRTKIGERVCGYIRPGQLDQLNNEFELWSGNYRTTMRRVALFSFLVVFGLTLFSCEEEEAEIIETVQKTGMAILKNPEIQPEKDMLDSAVMPEAKIEPIEDKVEEHVVEEVLLLGQVAEHVDDQPLMKECYDMEISGGMRLSDEYAEYMTITTPESTDVVAEKIEEHYEFEPLAFPNSTADYSTVRFGVDEEAMTEVRLSDMTGNHLETIVSRKLAKGEYDFRISLINYPVGTYLVSIVSGENSKMLRVVKR